MPELPEHRQTEPLEWQPLINQTQEILAIYGGLTRPAAEVGISLVDELDNEALEVNRYYGLGKMMCGFTVLLCDPAVRSTVVDDGAALLVQEALRRQQYASDTRSGLCVDDILQTNYDQAFLPLRNRVYDRLEIPEQVLGDTLEAVNAKRIAGLICENYGLGEITQAPLQQYCIGRVLNRGASADTICRSAADGAQYVVARTLQLKYEAELGFTPTEALNHRVEEIIYESGLQNLGVKKFATQVAGVRTDEFNRAQLDAASYLDTNGAPVLDRSHFPSPPPLANTVPGSGRSISLHEARLGCPAVRVSGLIDVILHLMPDMILAAQRQL